MSDDEGVGEGTVEETSTPLRDEEIMLEGILRVQGKGGFFGVKPWWTRYFVLARIEGVWTLRRYASEEHVLRMQGGPPPASVPKSKPPRVYRLKAVTEVQMDEEPERFYIRLKAKTVDRSAGPIHKFKCDDEEDAEQWVRALRLAQQQTMLAQQQSEMQQQQRPLGTSVQQQMLAQQLQQQQHMVGGMNFTQQQQMQFAQQQQAQQQQFMMQQQMLFQQQQMQMGAGAGASSGAGATAKGGSGGGDDDDDDDDVGAKPRARAAPPPKKGAAAAAKAPAPAAA